MVVGHQWPAHDLAAQAGIAQALSDGMITLKMDGMNKVLQGVTDMAQVRAVCIK